MSRIRFILASYLASERDKQVIWLVAGAFLFLFLSTPADFFHGFLFAEEGTTYLRYAWLAGPIRALFAPHQQYFALLPNLFALIEARLLPLSWAAVFAAWAVLGVHLWLISMVAQCERFTSGVTRFLAVALVLLAPGAALIVVGSTQTQFIFALMCTLVLISDLERLRVPRTLVTLIGGLNGVVSCMLAPFFLYRACRTGSRIAWLQASFLGLCTLFQAAVLRHALPFASRGTISHRSIFATVNVLANHVLVLPFLTRFLYHPVSLLGTAPPLVFWVFVLASLCGFALLAALLWPAGKWARLLLGIAAFHACCSVVGIEGDYQKILGGGERYFFVANTAIALALLLRWQASATASSLSTLKSRLISCALILIGVSGCVDALRFWKLNQSGPVWSAEIQAWKQDPSNVPLTVNPISWRDHQMCLPLKPVSLNIPFYLFDSNTRAEALRTAQWEGLLRPCGTGQ